MFGAASQTYSYVGISWGKDDKVRVLLSHGQTTTAGTRISRGPFRLRT